MLFKKFRVLNFRGLLRPRKFFNNENFSIYGICAQAGFYMPSHAGLGGSHIWLVAIELQIPQGLEQSNEEEELYEEVEDTYEQHSQLTMRCMPRMLNLTAGFKFKHYAIITSSTIIKLRVHSILPLFHCYKT